MTLRLGECYIKEKLCDFTISYGWDCDVLLQDEAVAMGGC